MNSTAEESKRIDCLVWHIEVYRQLRQALDPFVIQCLQATYSDAWKREGLRLANTRKDKNGASYVVTDGRKIDRWERIQKDAQKLLNLMLYNKEPFAGHLGSRGELLVDKLSHTRNEYTHDQTVDQVRDLAAAYEQYSELFEIVGYSPAIDVKGRLATLHAILLEHNTAPSTLQDDDIDGLKATATRNHPLASRFVSSLGLKYFRETVAIVGATVALVGLIWFFMGRDRISSPSTETLDMPTHQESSAQPPVQTAAANPGALVTAPGAETTIPTAPPRRVDAPDDPRPRGRVSSAVTGTSATHERYVTDAKTDGTLFAFAPSTNPTIEATLTSAFQATSGIFTPAFFRDGLFERVYQGDLAVLNDLRLPDTAVLYACRASERRTGGEALDPDLKRSEVHLTCRRLVTASRTTRLVDVTGVGAGYSDDAAFRVGLEHAVQAFKSQSQESQ